MIIDMIESLMSGDRSYAKALELAKPFWDRFFTEHENDTDAELQGAIDGAQISFQWEMEKAGLVPPFAKSIMALTAIGSLYADGFDDKDFATRVVNSFVGSRSLSVDVKLAAEDVAELYGLKREAP